MASKVTLEAFNSECNRWRKNPNKTERLGQRLMNGFSVGESNPEIFYENDHDKASKMFYEKYVAR